MRSTYPLFIAGKAEQPGAELEVTDKFRGTVAARVALAGAAEIERAIVAARAALPETRRMPSHERQAVLERIVAAATGRRDELADTLRVEVGKTIRDARGEVARMLETLRLSAEEAGRIRGEYLALDSSPRTSGYEGVVKRFPIGVCAFITPFNFPLNLAAHKIGPAIAAGCPWILKPASATPVSSLVLGEIIAEAGLPRGAFSIVPCRPADATRLASDERIAKLSFTGSPAVGWALRAQAGRKRVTLELGGNAPCIVDRDVEVETAAERLTLGAFYQSGQSCISVQRILVHASLYAPLTAALVRRAAALRMGDPAQENVDLGPLISEADARRVEAWVAEAVAGGARVLCGGRRHGALFEPTLLESVDPRQRVSCQEVFGPVATVQAFDDFHAALASANESEYGLQAGVFTRDLDHAWLAFNELEFGGVVINDIPSMRADCMPYGGVKMSGIGREGVRYAIEEMTEPRLLVLHNAGR